LHLEGNLLVHMIKFANVGACLIICVRCALGWSFTCTAEAVYQGLSAD